MLARYLLQTRMAYVCLGDCINKDLSKLYWERMLQIFYNLE
jgi:hypothetical protein